MDFDALMNDLDALLADEQPIIQPEPAKPAKPVIRVRAGGTITEAMIKVALGIPTAAQKLVSWVQSRSSQHVVGGTCPHCQGTGRYHLHTQPGSNGKCYRCHGKGRLDSKDMAYLSRRLGGAGPICWVVSAPAA